MFAREIMHIFLDENMIDATGWKMLSGCGRLSARFIVKYHSYLDMNSVIQSQVVETKVLYRLFNLLTIEQLEYIAYFYPMTEYLATLFALKYPMDIVWVRISQKADLSESFIDRFAAYLDWTEISLSGAVDNDCMLSKYSHCIEWLHVIKRHSMGEPLIRYINDYGLWNNIEWAYALMYQKIPEDILEANKDNLMWDIACTYQKLSPEFMTRNAEYLDWHAVSNYQRLNWTFYQLFADKLEYCQNVNNNIDRWFRIAPIESKLGYNIWTYIDQFIVDRQVPLIPTIDVSAFMVVSTK